MRAVWEDSILTCSHCETVWGEAGHEGRVLLGGLLVSFLDELVDLGESGLKTSYGTLSTSLREEPLTVVPQRVLDEKVEEMCFLKSSSDKQGNNRKQKSDKYSNFETTLNGCWCIRKYSRLL